jgi:hypothetical protein
LSQKESNIYSANEAYFMKPLILAMAIELVKNPPRMATR